MQKKGLPDKSLCSSPTSFLSTTITGDLGGEKAFLRTSFRIAGGDLEAPVFSRRVPTVVALGAGGPLFRLETGLAAVRLAGVIEGGMLGFFVTALSSATFLTLLRAADDPTRRVGGAALFVSRCTSGFDVAAARTGFAAWASSDFSFFYIAMVKIAEKGIGARVTYLHRYSNDLVTVLADSDCLRRLIQRAEVKDKKLAILGTRIHCCALGGECETC